MKITLKSKKLQILSLVLLGLLESQSFGQSCANSVSSGVAGPGTSPNTPKGGDPFVVYSGNEYRDIKDLKIWGGVGEHQLVWERWANSRYVNGQPYFGTGHCWRHGYQWEMADAGLSSNNLPQIEIVYPDGTDITFVQMSGTNVTKWYTPNAQSDALSASSDGNNFYLQRPNGWVYHFTKNHDSQGNVYYLMTDFKDSQQNDYTLSYNSAHEVVQVTEPGGRYLQIEYTPLNVNKIDFNTIATISTTPAAGVYGALLVSDTTAYRYVRYLSPWCGYGMVSELLFTGTDGTVLSGSAFGTTAASSSNTFVKAFDGNPSTGFKSAARNGGFVGLDLGRTVTIGAVQFLPTAGSESRMLNGLFQGSNQAPATIDVISSVTTSDGRTVNYSYTPFYDATLPYSYQTLTSVTYDDGIQATYTYGQVYPTTRPLITAYVDPRYDLPFTKAKTAYFDAGLAVLGEIQKQLNYDTGEVLNTVGLFNGDTHIPMTTKGNGGTESYSMQNGVLQVQTDSLGNTTTYTYDSRNFVSGVTDALNRTTSQTNTKWNNPLTITNPDGSVKTWTRDSLDLPLTYKDELGRTTKWTRDSNHRVTKITYPDNTTESFTYNSFGQPLTHTLRNGGVESCTYDSTGLLTSKTDALNNLTNFTHDSAGRLASVTDARGNTTSLQYNARGLLTQMTNPDGTIRSFGYDNFGNKTSVTDELGHTTTFTYDTFNRITSCTDALNRTTQFVFRSNYYFEKPDKVILPSGKKVANVYDLEDHLLSTTVGYGTPDAAITQFGYDAAYNQTSQTDPLGHAWTFQYDNRNRKTSATDPLNNITRWSYDAVNNPLTTTRPDGGVTTNVYDSMNRLKQSTDPKSQVTVFGYDNANNMVSLTDSKGNTYSFTYDLISRKLSMKYPDNSQELFGYDAVGNNIQYATRTGQIRTSIFDNRNRETQTAWSDSTPAVARTFDGAGRLLSLVNAASSISFGYDNSNELASETTALPGQNPQTVSYSYTADGNRATMTTPAGSLVQYAYTNRNQVASITSDGAPPVASYIYDAAGNRIGRSLENAIATAYQYDNANRLLGVLHSGTSFLANYGYTLNTVGNRTSRTETTGTNAPAQDAYGYDAVDQVTGVNYASGHTVNYAYDYVGNRTSVIDSGTTTSYAVNILNQYTQIGTHPVLGYDGNGNLNNNYTGWTYTYDAQNRLVSGSNGTSAATFAYDARNRCVSRTSNGVTTNLYYDGWNLIEERDANGNLGSRYVHGVADDEMLAKFDGTNAVYYHQDGLGNTVALSDTTGAMLERYTYDVYGAPTILDGSNNILATSAIGNRFLYTGHEWLASLNLYDYRNRVYSADLGRFLQTDPIRFAAGDINIYGSS